MTHNWRFFRSGGFDQVRLDRIEDWHALEQLDPKLWAALSCPVRGLSFDSRTLQYLDSDQDGRIRIDEIKAAVRWALSMLKTPDVLLSGDALPLAAINSSTAEGQRLFASAKRILANLHKPEQSQLCTADTDDLCAIFPADQCNGDGIITEQLAPTAALKLLLQSAIACGFISTDRSGAAGINETQLTEFLALASQRAAWMAQGADFNALFDGNVAAVAELVQALDGKVTDYFTRCQLTAYDSNAAAALNANSDDYQALTSQLLSAQSSDSLQLPLARVSADAKLPLASGLHPHWAASVQQLVVLLHWQHKSTLDANEWDALKKQVSPFLAWQQAEPAGAISALDEATLTSVLEPSVQQQALTLMAEDIAAAGEADAVLDVDKLVRYQRYLREILQNFVSFEQFYSLEHSAIFQSGRLYIDGRSCDLCLEVQDAGKHAKLAALSGTYLLYVDCVRAKTGEKKQVVAAVTAGDAGNLMAGRNGVFYDRQGQDWDATVISIVQNPISIREAFYTPYQRIGRMISEQIQKFAAAKDKEIESKSASGVGDAAKLADNSQKPASVAPFDVAKFAGIFAAIGLAIGAIGTALASVVTAFLGLMWWQMPLALLGIVLFISGPSMLIAWFKLRTRNLAPLLDANGWAVNTNAKLSLPFGVKLTALASIPAGASRSLQDPYAAKSNSRMLIVLLVVIAVAIWAYQQGLFAQLLA